jgi:hypothetical protein
VFSAYDLGIQVPGMVCTPVPLPSFLDGLIQNGKSALEVLEWIAKLDAL